jgi:hypothetical protein
VCSVCSVCGLMCLVLRVQFRVCGAVVCGVQFGVFDVCVFEVCAHAGCAVSCLGCAVRYVRLCAVCSMRYDCFYTCALFVSVGRACGA